MRFLIVDDDESIHMYLEMVLAPFAQCDCANTGEKGIEILDAALEAGLPYDVVFMDILMPGMDGHQAAEVMRDLEIKRGVGDQNQFKLVMVSSLVDDLSVSKAFYNTHATCYIIKPLDKEKVLDELKQNLII